MFILISAHPKSPEIKSNNTVFPGCGVYSRAAFYLYFGFQVRRLFKGGVYSRSGFIRGNTVTANDLFQRPGRPRNGLF